MHLCVQVAPEDATDDEAEPHGDQDDHLPGVDNNLCFLHDIEPTPIALLAQQDHGHPPQRGTDVSDGARHVRRSDARAEVGGAHRVLQPAGDGGQARGRDVPLVASHRNGCNEQASIANQGNPVQRLAAEVHLVFVDEEATREGTEKERQ
eukprot:CAMPEP_0204005876 /NCGR_PEP_ID=MMETSP0360-20130528/19400_1 /ASSEMBLY_ACC=CAM_ASM_000342 /TAXON_ID=268821 /ORGANISM="Scrippsiella Hangoei, Strain SHTV-5" /LENGTH=149 /DNA_ID=CAMNT_0050947919 /DNA_START=697 /DNA_END=1146 /DNA_ORIENTATION=-